MARRVEANPVLEVLKSGNPAAPVISSCPSLRTRVRCIELVQRHDVANLVAKHGAIRAVYPVIDERELLVTCTKVLHRDIFGIEKYVGSWGVQLYRSTVTSIADKAPFLSAFEEYLTALDCPRLDRAAIVTVAEELLLNAVVHAPHVGGQPKLRASRPARRPRPRTERVRRRHLRLRRPAAHAVGHQSLRPPAQGHALRLPRARLRRDALARIEDERRGTGLSFAYRSIHQLIFNIHDQKRTEVIAGWYLRVATASEFRQVSKSLNVFWLPSESSVRQDEPADEGEVRTLGTPDEPQAVSSFAIAPHQSMLGGVAGDA